jgi:type VI secretion system secreted protein VgrG
MAEYTQQNRPMRAKTALGPDVLLLSRFSGHEGVSIPFVYHLDLSSKDDKIDPKALLRTPITITIDHSAGKRFINGFVNRFSQGDSTEDLTSYRAEIVPWLWFTTLSKDCKIYQNKSAVDIIQEVFSALGYSDFELQVRGSIPVREYCVQYRETHFNFVSRLMEEEGIFYFFKHSDGKHTMVLSDDKEAFEPTTPASARVGMKGLANEDIVTSVEREHFVHIGKVTLSEYDWLQPNLSLRTQSTGPGKEEVHDYGLPVYTTIEGGQRYARIQLEAEEVTHHTVRGHSTCRFFASGHRFDLKEHYRPDVNGAYVLTEVHHSADNGDYLSGGGDFQYFNEFVCIPKGIPYRAPARAQKPLIQGSQTALVVGPAGEEVYTDKYGRIKVQFYWDRDGKKSDDSSCWVRVSSPWAGKGWGAISVPRINNEVVIEFLEGDPDQPLVVGSVYNAEQTVPFTLPGQMIQMGMKSRSSKGGGGYNEITLTDTKGKELITIHGQFDMDTMIEHDDRMTVGNDQTISIGNNRTETVGNNESITISGNRTEAVAKDETITISGKRTETVEKDESITINGARTETVAKDETIDVGGARSTSIGKDETVNIAGKRTTQVEKDEVLDVGKKMAVVAADEIVVKTGDASITMKKDGTITIKGKDIKFEASGKITGKASSDVVLKGSKVAAQ